MEERRFADRIQGIKGNAIRELLKVSQQPGMISFAGGLPSPDSFDIETINKLFINAMERDGKRILQYGSTEGYQPLLDELLKCLRRQGFDIGLENLIVLSGSQQGINLVSKALLNPGDQVAVESPSYLAALQIFRTYQVEYVVIPADQDGMDIDVLTEKLATEKPKIIYIVPTFQNPSSATLSMERRQQVAKLLSQHEVILVEDNPYGDLRYSGDHLPSIYSLDQSQQTLYLGSFSKTIAPGLRVGYAIGSPDLINKIKICKQGTDVHTSMVSQAIVSEYLNQGLYEPHIEDVKTLYRGKRDLFLAEMTKNFPAEVKWNFPEGGLFIWAELPSGYDARDLFNMAIAEKVAFVPGETFFVDGRKNCFRLNFSNASEENIVIGLKRLGDALRLLLAK